MGIISFFKKDSSKQNLEINWENPIDDIEIQKEGYHEIINLCVGDSKKEVLLDSIKELKNYNGTVAYNTIFASGVKL